MFVVLFEVQPKRHQWDRYLELAAVLRPELVEIRGFIGNERYLSERSERRLLSLSTWEDEKALVRWRTHALHHEVQGVGRGQVFEDYHLRVGEVVTDSASAELPQTRFDVTEIGAAPAATVVEVEPGQEAPDAPMESADLVDVEWYTSITTEGRRLLLAGWRTQASAAAWVSEQASAARCRHIRIVRDYGMRERTESPQHFQPVEG